jgi:hypothetical protein
MKNLAELKQFYVDLDYADLTPASINGKISKVLENFSNITDYMVGAVLNLNLAKKALKAAKLERDLSYSGYMLSADVSGQKSKELREAKCALLSEAAERSLLKIAQDELDAVAYYESVKFIYENLEMALGSMKEQVKLFQNMLFLDPAGHR